MANWDQLASAQTIEKTVAALKISGIEVEVVENAAAARQKVLELIPAGSEVMTMSSTTLDTMGLSEEINRTDGKFKPVRDKLYAMDRSKEAQEMNRLGSAPQFTVGSVHAVTVDGHVLIASNTGSQLPAYAYSGLNVIWVVGAQKIVRNTEEGIKRIYEHSLPLESERAKKAYNVPGSAVNKILIINREVQPGRIKLILVKEKLGF
ncbi:MAG: LUD domain-containing protein [Candidatus Daviesbacteria bacterium]|nr:MAG: LUD domain-containing protein [Candidatus Daviesbacteria bacterium]